MDQAVEVAKLESTHGDRKAWLIAHRPQDDVARRKVLGVVRANGADVDEELHVALILRQLGDVPGANEVAGASRVADLRDKRGVLSKVNGP